MGEQVRVGQVERGKGPQHSASQPGARYKLIGMRLSGAWGVCFGAIGDHVGSGLA